MQPQPLQEVDGILGGHVACRSGHKRAAPQAARRHIKKTDTGLEACIEIDQPKTTGIVQMQRKHGLRASGPDGGYQVLDRSRMGQPGGIGKIDFPGASRRQLSGGIQDHSVFDITALAITKGALEPGSHLEPCLHRLDDKRLHAGQGFGGGHAAILAAVAVGKGNRHADMGKSGVLGPRQPFFIQDQAGAEQVRVLPADPSNQIIGICHLRHGLGVNKAAQLNPPHPCRHQQTDNLKLLLQAEQASLALQPIPQRFIFQDNIHHPPPSRLIIPPAKTPGGNSILAAARRICTLRYHALPPVPDTNPWKNAAQVFTIGGHETRHENQTTHQLPKAILLKIINILGSARKNGTSARIARAFAETAATYGATVTEYYLNGMQYRGCQGCEGCHTRSDRCILRDGLTPVLTEMYTADLVIFSAPVYFGDTCGQFKSFFDRMWSLLQPDAPEGEPPSRLPQGKTAILILTHVDDADTHQDVLERYTMNLGLHGFAVRPIAAPGLRIEPNTDIGTYLDEAATLARELMREEED